MLNGDGNENGKKINRSFNREDKSLRHVAIAKFLDDVQQTENVT